MDRNKKFFELIGTDKPTIDDLKTVEDSRPECSAPAPAPVAPPQNNQGFRSWAQSDNTFYGVSESHKVLPVGIYRCGLSSTIGPVFFKQIISTDELMVLPDSASEAVLKEIVHFRKLKENFQKYGYLHKRGILLWGPPGSGKTATINLLTNLIVEKENGIAIISENPYHTAQCLQLFRRIESSRPAVVILEDLDALIERFGENEHLSLLDGESQVDNIVFVATTNYPERLDKRFVDRPSRFDTIKYIGMPSTEARRFYLKSKLIDVDNKIIEDFIRKSDGFSVAHLRELVILTQCFGHDSNDAISRLKTMIQNIPASDKAPESSGFGFTGK